MELRLLKNYKLLTNYNILNFNLRSYGSYLQYYLLRLCQEKVYSLVDTFFKKMGQPRPLFVYFQSFLKQTIQISQQINVKKCPSSIRHWDSNT